MNGYFQPMVGHVAAYVGMLWACAGWE